PRLPERRDRGDDEPRVRGAERRRATAEPGQRAGRLALDEHVGAGGEAAERRRARGRPPVERDAALAGAVEPEEEAPLRALDALPEGRDRAQRGAAWRLDEDDVGAEAGEELPRKRALLIGEIEDADAVQRARHRRGKYSATSRARSSCTSWRSRGFKSSVKSGVSADEKQMKRKSRRCRRAISSSVSATAFDQISLSPAIEPEPSRQTIIGPRPRWSAPRSEYERRRPSTRRRAKS